MSNHAILSPSAAERWLNCTPSARLEQEYPDSSNQAADEGTLAHSLGELLIKKQLKLISKKEFKYNLALIEELELYSEAMAEHAENYAAFVLEKYAEALSHTKDAMIFIEEQIDLSAYVPEGFGTGDVFIIANQTLDFVDLKYGKGVYVSAEENKQLKLYALGALDKYDFLYDIETVRMTIYQPRMDNISTFEISAEELKEWGENYLKPKAAQAFEGVGEFLPGKHCQFCKAAGTCKANAEFNQELAKYDFQNPDTLDANEVSEILSRAGLFYNWLSAVEKHALEQAVNHGKQWPGYKVVEGRSNRKYADEGEVAKLLERKGFTEEEIYKKKLLGIGAMEAALGKKVFASLLTDHLIKPPGKPALVPESDKRPEYNSTEAAKKDFAS